MEEPHDRSEMENRVKEIKYADAGMDMKKLVLCLMNKCWLVLVAALAGAITGGLLYTAASVVPEAEREYRAVSKLYLDFAADATGEVYQAYNGYTWNDLMKTDPILDRTMANLAEPCDREEVAKATQAEILSDLRLLTITITTHDIKKTDVILAATDAALEEYGEAAKEFIQIETIETTPAKLVTADSRLVQAVVLGMVIALVVMLFAMLLYYVTDDRIFVAGDIRPVTELPFLGYQFGKDVKNVFQQDYEKNLAYFQEKYENLGTVILVQGQSLPAEKLQEMRDWKGMVVSLPYGKVHGTYLAYQLEQLKIQDCKVVGVTISEPEEKLLRRYYGKSIGRI